MAVGDYFFYKGFNNRNAKLSQNDKKQLVDVRRAIFQNLNKTQSDPRAENEDTKKTALTDIPDIPVIAGEYAATSSIYSKYIYSAESTKKEKLKIYREMAKYPEISFAVDEYVNGAISFDKKLEAVNLIIKNKSLSENEVIRKTILYEWDFIINNVVKFSDHVDSWFRDFMIDGELFFEKVFDNDHPELGITRVKRLLTSQISPVFSDDIESEEILFFAYIPQASAEVVNFPKDLVAYSNSGLIVWGLDEKEITIESFLEVAKTTYRRLKLLEDALVIYRLCLDGETRIKTENGYRYIKDININDIVYSYDSGILIPTKVTKVWNNGLKDVLKVRTRHVELICTENHPILINNKENNKLEYIDAGKLEIKKHQLIIPKIEEKSQKTKIVTNFGEPYAKLKNSTFKSENCENKTTMIKDISEEISYPFNRIWQFLYVKNKAIPKEIAEKICDKLHISYDNLIYTNKGQIKVERLNVPEYIDEEFARLFGFLIGDGSITKNAVIFAEGEYESVNKEYSDLLKKYFGDCNLYKSKGRLYNNYKTNSTIAANIFKNLGYIHGFANKRIPEWVFNSSNSIKLAFIEGLSDADGCERYTNAGTWFSSIQLANKNLIEDIKELWMSLGLSSGKITQRPQRSHFYKNRKISSNLSWTITLTKIPLGDYENIISIEPFGQREVFDIEVESIHHNFIANGVPVHNCRAPERRIFNIDVGGLPKGKAEQFIRETIQRHRQKALFDPTTGDLIQGIDPIAMTEDYYFPVFQGGRQSKIETLPGGQHLNEIDDVEYFLKKLYRSLKIPLGRFGEDKKVQFGESGEMDQDELKFSIDVKRFSRRFARIFKDIFLTHLRLRGIAKEIGISEEDIEVEMFNNNLIEKFLESKVLELKFAAFEKFKDMIDMEKQKPFSQEWAIKKYIGISDEDWSDNVKLRNIEKAAAGGDEEGEGGGGGGGMDMGGGDVGGDAGGDAGGDTGEAPAEPPA